MAIDFKVVTPGTVTSLDNTTSKKALSANQRRKYATISNPNNVGIWINFGAAAVIGTGEYIPAGSIWEMDKDNMYQGEVWVIAASGSGYTLGTMEMQ